MPLDEAPGDGALAPEIIRKSAAVLHIASGHVEIRGRQPKWRKTTWDGLDASGCLLVSKRALGGLRL